jgi:hypothetical protein
LFLGCVIRTQARYKAEAGYEVDYSPPPPIVVVEAPPAPKYETPPPKPSPNAIWIEGYWHWTGSSWIWRNGYWTSPRPGYVWVKPRYKRERKIYIRGHWRPIKRVRPVSAKPVSKPSPPTAQPKLKPVKPVSAKPVSKPSPPTAQPKYREALPPPKPICGPGPYHKNCKGMAKHGHKHPHMHPHPISDHHHHPHGHPHRPGRDHHHPY